MTDTIPAEIADCAPTTKLIYRTLTEQSDPTPLGELADQTTIHPRNVRSALRELQERGLAECKHGLEDGRERRYHLTHPSE